MDHVFVEIDGLVGQHMADHPKTTFERALLEVFLERPDLERRYRETMRQLSGATSFHDMMDRTGEMMKLSEMVKTPQLKAALQRVGRGYATNA